MTRACLPTARRSSGDGLPPGDELGISAGSLVGAALLPGPGPRLLTLVGGLLALAALAVDARRHTAGHLTAG
jgi:hypothetical protein